MKMILEKEDFLRNAIRDIVAVNPMVSIRSVQRLVENNTGYPISKNFAAKLTHKARKQAVVESDRKKLNERLAEVRERYRVLLQYLQRAQYWKFEYWTEYAIPEPTFKEKLAIIKLQAQLESALFRTEQIAGAFQNNSMEVEFTKSQTATVRIRASQ